MACPHVAGQVAKYLDVNPTHLPAVVKTWITSNALSGVLRGVNANTPNLLLFGDCHTFTNPTNETIKLNKRY
jgi:subtilisin family serine protease